ncbi:MAG: molybdopterin-synthase adenylyltransferase MoeB [bacterium]|nr:molybdopterin-synthase adenylyltransferase MoeB [bacterium]
MMPSFSELISTIKREIREITPAKVQSRLQEKNPPVLIDVREAAEVEGGIVPGAITLSRGLLELQIEDEVADKSREVICYCAGGTRSALAAKALEGIGYTKVFSMTGGSTRWKNEGFPIIQKQGLSKDRLARYARHLSLPEVREEGQLKLLQSKVLLVGAGGLGSPTSLYLAAAGVGTIGIIDFDVVDLSNLQRQILHTESEVGHSKIASAQKRLSALNSDVRIIPYEEKLTRENILKIMEPYDVIVNGCDNFPTRYLVNDACVFTKKPMVDGSIFRFEGQVTVFDSQKGPCYRCLYPEPPPPEMAPSCSEAGVFGALCGIIGSIQGIETIKLLLNLGQPLVGRLVMYDALRQEFREMKVRKDPACPVCGTKPTITELIDYHQFCAGR